MPMPKREFIPEQSRWRGNDDRPPPRSRDGDGDDDAGIDLIDERPHTAVVDDDDPRRLSDSSRDGGASSGRRNDANFRV